VNYNQQEASRYQDLAHEAAAFARFFREQMKHSRCHYGEYQATAVVYQERSAALYRLACRHANDAFEGAAFR
jgi:hypothetical protein